MSTRCNIILQDDAENGRRIYLYHHHDGYPEGVGSDLAHFVTEWNKFYIYSIEEYANRLIKGIDSPFYEGEDKGYELTTGLHGDIEYLYVIHFAHDDEADKYTSTLEAYKVLWGEGFDVVADYPENINGISVIKSYPPAWDDVIDGMKVRRISL